MTTQRTDRRKLRRLAVEKAARRQGNVLSRRQLYALGVTRSETRAEVRAERWKRYGPQSLLVGPANDSTEWWRAVFEVGQTAALDGISALQAAGLKTITSDSVHVSVPKSAEYRLCRGVRVHETRRYREEDVIRVGIPRIIPPSPQFTPQSGRAPTTRPRCSSSRRCNRKWSAWPISRKPSPSSSATSRHLLQGLLADVSGGIESVGEREFAAACRRRGFPEPTRQVVRKLPSGRVRYDNVWEDYLQVEIDGAQHLDAAAAAKDTLNRTQHRSAARLSSASPTSPSALDPEPYLDQMATVFLAHGWRPPPNVRRSGRYSGQIRGRKLA